MRATTLAVTTANAISVPPGVNPVQRCIRYPTSFYNVHKEGGAAHAAGSARSSFTNEAGVRER